MRWTGGRRSQNIEDRRGQRTPRVGRGIKLGGGGMILALLVTMLFGGNPMMLLQMLMGGGGNMGFDATRPRQSQPRQKLPGQVRSGQQRPANSQIPGTPNDKLAEFTSAVLADTEDTWKKLLAEKGAHYREPKLVLFSDAVQSGCGVTSSAVGPFYCPLDSKVYLDLRFFTELHHRFGAPGDFAQAYVIAHEIGHHVQNLLGVSSKVQQARQRMSKSDGNKLSVLQELQADCFAGLWAHHAHRSRAILESGDIEEGLRAATAIGDDSIQKRTQGHVNPEAFTHGSARQRVEWFKRGLDKGTIAECDTWS